MAFQGSLAAVGNLPWGWRFVFNTELDQKRESYVAVSRAKSILFSLLKRVLNILYISGGVSTNLASWYSSFVFVQYSKQVEIAFMRQKRFHSTKSRGVCIVQLIAKIV